MSKIAITRYLNESETPYRFTEQGDRGFVPFRNGSNRHLERPGSPGGIICPMSGDEEES